MRWLMVPALALAVAPVPAAAEDAPALKEFLAMAMAALDSCQAEGFHVSVAVVDAAGNPKLMLRGDGAAPHTPESAGRKAYTAASFGIATAKLRDLALQQPDVAGLARLDQVIFVGGGLPIRIGPKMVGGIGVAGGVGPGQDEACARAGLPKGQ